MSEPSEQLLGPDRAIVQGDLRPFAPHWPCPQPSKAEEQPLAVEMDRVSLTARGSITFTARASANKLEASDR